MIQRSWAAAAAGTKANGTDTYASGKDVKMVHVHGWVYELETGRLRDLGVSCGPFETEADDVYVDGVTGHIGHEVSVATL